MFFFMCGSETTPSFSVYLAFWVPARVPYFMINVMLFPDNLISCQDLTFSLLLMIL